MSSRKSFRHALVRCSDSADLNLVCAFFSDVRLFRAWRRMQTTQSIICTTLWLSGSNLLLQTSWCGVCLGVCTRCLLFSILSGPVLIAFILDGYVYPCIDGSDERNCLINPVPFRNASCSDAAGSQEDYSQLMRMLTLNVTTGRQWDDQQKAPWFNFLDESGVQHQVTVLCCNLLEQALSRIMSV
jgi:hypothetical protein